MKTNHPTIVAMRERLQLSGAQRATHPIDAAWLRQLCLDSGAADVGFVEASRAGLEQERQSADDNFPGVRSFISFVCRINQVATQSPARSASNLEFHAAYDESNAVARRIVTRLQEAGYRAMNPAAGFPMEMDNFPGRIWVVSHKPIAVAAGLGQIGIHRNVIHPKFGNFVALNTILVDSDITQTGQPIDYNPCLECKLCVAACPVGAISPEGDFNFSACMTHNYREFMGGFTDWTEKVVESRSAVEYREQVSDSETASMWQSLSFKSNYKAAYCLAVCPAGEEVIMPFISNKPQFLKQVLKPLTEKEEVIYVVPGSDAEEYVPKRFPKKSVKRVSNGIRPKHIDGFLFGLKLIFQPGQSKGLDAVYHFRFTGREQRDATVVIRGQAVAVSEGLEGKANLTIRADTATWIGFLAKERSLVWALLRRKIILHGSPKLLLAFGKCFPS